MKGWRTLIFNGVVVVLTALLTFVVGVNWTDYGVSAGVGALIVAGANIVLRFITTTPPLTKDPEPPPRG